MNSSEVNEVIEMLCKKFGTVKEKLFPEIVRMNVGRNAVNTAMCLIVLIVLILIVRHGIIVQNNKSNDYDVIENWTFASFICGITAAGFFIAFWINLFDLVQWVVAPTAKTFEYILTLL